MSNVKPVPGTNGNQYIPYSVDIRICILFNICRQQDFNIGPATTLQLDPSCTDSLKQRL